MEITIYTPVPRSPGDTVDGALIALRSNKEVQELDLREKNYVLEPCDRTHIRVRDGTVQGKISYFVPIRHEVVDQDLDADRTQGKVKYAIRQGYLESINVALNALGFAKKIAPPEDVEIRRAFTADRLAAQRWSETEDSVLHRFNQEVFDDFNIIIRDYLDVIDEKRDFTIHWCIRPIIFSRDFYDNITSIAEAAVSLSSKASDLVLTDGTAPEKAGYKDRDFHLARKIFKNNQGRLPEIARVDLTVHGNRVNVFEVNCDSLGGMFHIDFLRKIQQRFCEELDLTEHLDFDRQKDLCPLVKAMILRKYSAFAAGNGGVARRPLVAIVEKKSKGLEYVPGILSFQAGIRAGRRC